MDIGKYAKAIVALISGGGLSAAGLELGLSIEIMTPVVALITAILTWAVPNSK